jgi:hypothetical protein
MSSKGFEKKLNQWLEKQLAAEQNPRRRELLQNEIGHATKTFLKTIWYPVAGHFEHLYLEWEIRDYGGKYRYLDLAYLPGGAKGCIEIHGYRSHARDIEALRFRDLCKKQSYLVMDDWIFLPIAYLSIEEEPEIIKQIVLAFIGKFVTTTNTHSLSWIEEETLKFARGRIRLFHSGELALHLKRSDRQARRILNKLVERNLFRVHNEQQRYRSYQVVVN